TGAITVVGTLSQATTPSYTLTVSVTAGSTSTATAMVKVDVLGAPDPQYANAPIGLDDCYAVDLNQPNLTVSTAQGVLANDIWADPLTAVVGNLPTKGDLSLNSDGSFIYTPWPGESGWDKFTYQPRAGGTNGEAVAVNLLLAQAPAPYTINVTIEYNQAGGP